MNFLKYMPSFVSNGFNLLSHKLITPPSCTVVNSFSSSLIRNMVTLARLHKQGPYIKPKKANKVMTGKPFVKGVILKTLVKKPRKPNSANRKCVWVKLSNGKEVFAYVPGIGHNLQEHQFVLIRGGRLKDCPGVKVRCVRGAYDLPHVGK